MLGSRLKRWLGGLWNTLTGTAARGRRQTRDRSGQRCRFHPALHPLEDRLAPAVASITPLSWNVVGLDSNNVNVGPNAFLIGARVTADNAGVSNLVVRYIEDGANNTLISPVGATTLTQATLAPGASQDFYFTVSVTRSSAAYTTVQKYHIEAFQDVGNDQLPNSGETVLSTPPNRELFVEHLISQNRNNVDSVSVLGKPPVDPANPQPVRVED